MKLYTLTRTMSRTRIVEQCVVESMTVLAETQKQARSIAHQEARRLASQEKGLREVKYAYEIADDWLDPARSRIDEECALMQARVINRERKWH